MSVLPDHELVSYCEEGLIRPYSPDLVQPASYDVRLADRVLIPLANGPVLSTKLGFNVIDLNQPIPDHLYREEDIGQHGAVLYPHQCLLGATIEEVNIPPHLVGRIEGKSSLGRVFLTAHITAGYLDPGFRGNVTLEIVNLLPRPLRLYTGMKIAQLSFETMSSPARRPYGDESIGSHYQDSRGVVPSRFGA